MGTFLRTGSAFGVKEVLVVGSDRFGTHGGHNAHKYVNVQTFHTCDDVKTYLKSRQVHILGLQTQEIESTCVDSHPFHGATAFVLGNEGGILSEDQRDICDGFIHISHYLPTKTIPSTIFELDLTVQLGILLHGFTTWSGQYSERRMENTSTRGKFELEERKPREKCINSDIIHQRREKKDQIDAVMNDDLELGLWSADI